MTNGLISIGNYAFCGSDISEIIIPASVKTIGKGAFLSCMNLKKVIINGCCSLHAYSFHHCEQLKTVVLRNGLRSLGFEAFGDCKNLIEIIDLSNRKFFCIDRFISKANPLFSKLKTPNKND